MHTLAQAIISQHQQSKTLLSTTLLFFRSALAFSDACLDSCQAETSSTIVYRIRAKWFPYCKKYWSKTMAFPHIPPERKQFNDNPEYDSTSDSNQSPNNAAHGDVLTQENIFKLSASISALHAKTKTTHSLPAKTQAHSNSRAISSIGSRPLSRMKVRPSSKVHTFRSTRTTTANVALLQNKV